MAEHKKQHFVPKCYLRRFSPDPEGKFIHLYNIESARLIPRASIKGQCAKNYLHGDDLKLEHALHFLETKYASIVKSLHEGSQALSPDDFALLRLFAFIQYGRTDMAIKRLRMMHEGMEEAIFEGRNIKRERMNLSDRFLIQESIRLYIEMHKQIEDLKICIAKNETPISLVSSDDPAVFTSRFYIQRLKQREFGFGSSGAMIYLPISSNFLLLCYDSGVYHIPKMDGHLTRIRNKNKKQE